MYCDLWLQYIQVRKLFKGGNYSREETIQGRKLFAEIRYLFLDNSREVLLTMLSLFPLNNSFVFFWTTSNFRLLHPLPLTTTITNSTWGKFLLKLLTVKNIRQEQQFDTGILHYYYYSLYLFKKLTRAGEHVVYKNCSECQNNFCTQHVLSTFELGIFMY